MTQSTQLTHELGIPPLRPSDTEPSPRADKLIQNSRAKRHPLSEILSPTSTPHQTSPLPPALPSHPPSNLIKCTCEACLGCNNRALQQGVMETPSHGGIASVRVGEVCLNERKVRNVRFECICCMCIYDAISGEVLQIKSSALDTSCEHKPVGVLKTWGEDFSDSDDSVDSDDSDDSDGSYDSYDSEEKEETHEEDMELQVP